MKGNPMILVAWLRARTRFDQRGVASQGLLVTVLVVLAIVALAFWLITSFGVHKK